MGVKTEATMAFGIILETKGYAKAWNALRFAVAVKRNGHADYTCTDM